MKSISTKIKDSTSRGLLIESGHITFLGLHNPNRFRRKIETWLPELDLRETSLLVVDNASTDNSISWTLPLLQSLRTKFCYLRNDRNLGGYGSLFENIRHLDNVNWITMLHQDDFYKHNHVNEHLRCIRSAARGIGIICTEAISETVKGEKLAFPRVNWLLDDNADPVTLFLATIRSHVYPFSGATIRRSILLENPLPLDSQAFPDTEITLKMLPRYKGMFAPFGTVGYLENPQSESHSLSLRNREVGTFEALRRVFESDSFAEICDLVVPADRNLFLRNLYEGIEVRVADQTMSNELKEEVRQRIMKLFHTTIHGDALVKTQYIWLASTPSSKINQIKSNRSKRWQDVALRFARLVPRGIRRSLFRLVMNIPKIRRMYPQWDVHWRR